MAYRTVGAVVGGGLVIGFAATLYAAAASSLPPSSLEPNTATRAVRVSHRHQTVVACRHMTVPPSCVAQLREGDTATVVRFVRADVEPSGLRAGDATVRLALPQKQGSQQQVAMLRTGRWLVDWSGAPELVEFDVRPDSHLEIALATVSGACVQKGERCQLVSGVRERRIRIDNAN